MVVAGVISDTHGLLRPEAIDALCGVDLILHAGDVGRREVLDALQEIAPVHAISGNVDVRGWLPETLSVQVGGCRVHLVHRIADLAVRPADYEVIIYGHSHKPSVEDRGGVLFVNPGSAGPRRFRLPVTIARLRFEGINPTASIVQLLP